MKMQRDERTALVEVQFTSRAEARIALDRLEDFGVTVDIVRARIERGDVSYELLIYGPAADVAQAVGECSEWSLETDRSFARAG